VTEKRSEDDICDEVQRTAMAKRRGVEFEWKRNGEEWNRDDERRRRVE